MNKLYPLRFEPIYKQAIWGGKRIFSHFDRAPSKESCSESWEITDRTEGISTVVNGPLKGKDLHSLIMEYKERILGKGNDFSSFPLLIKIIDAHKPLSFQVHPCDQLAKEFDEEAKTEMWVVLDTVSTSYIYANFKQKITPDEFKKAIFENRVEDLVLKTRVHRNDAVYIPGRTLHAIGEGCLILEVQQSSNTTFRVYDWDRGRKLHIEKSLRTIDFSRTYNPIVEPKLLEKTKGFSLYSLLRTRFFSLERIDLFSKFQKKYSHNSFNIFFCVEGIVTLNAEGHEEEMNPGDTLLVPAELSFISLLKKEGSCQVIRIFLEDHI